MGINTIQPKTPDVNSREGLLLSKLEKKGVAK